MLGATIYLAVSLTAFMLGTQVLRLVRLSPDDEAERSLAAMVVGMTLLGLLVLAMGLLGWLRWWALAHLLLLSALAGLRTLDDCLRAVARGAAALWWGLSRSPLRAAYWAMTVIVILQLLAALAPPTPEDFDGTAEHLAMAKQWARDGRIHPLWYDHHSQFPATLQMHYTMAHAFGVPGAAKLFHWGFGLMAVAATVLAGRRLLAPAAGAYGALILATTPGLAWLMGVGYVDLATITCGILALYFFARWVREDVSWLLWLSAVMAGAGAAFKMQGLALLAVLAIGIVLALRSLRALRYAAAYLGIALILCSPWYLKSYLWTGNPVYPFAYELFGGKLWSADRAEQYRYSQREYGRSDLPPLRELREMPPLQAAFAGPRRPLNLLLAPINLTIDPPAFTVPMGAFAVWATDSVGPLWLALLPLLVLFRRPPPVRWMLWVLLPLYLWWLWSMQLTRYLLPSLALVAPAAAWAAVEAERHSRLLATVVRSALGAWTVIALALMVLYVGPQLPAAVGLVDADLFLAGRPLYAASEHVNAVTPLDAKVALYGEPRGYYLDRDYLWADRGHSALIDYDSVRTPEDLIAQWRRLGVTHVMIHAAQFPDIHRSHDRIARTIGAAVDQGLLERVSGPASIRPYRIFRLTLE
ncbi:MAG: glycosyltransferase family 39 protein [Armatimonadota bacterium]|nr:glycosyltransferase family 39 protein [Armatimonadota bacterium]